MRKIQWRLLHWNISKNQLMLYVFVAVLGNFPAGDTSDVMSGQKLFSYNVLKNYSCWNGHFAKRFFQMFSDAVEQNYTRFFYNFELNTSTNTWKQ